MNHAQMDSTGESKGSFKSYTAGLIVSIILTGIAFGMVMQGRGMPRGAVFAVIFAAAMVQILVHLRYFLHLDASSSSRWNVMALVFTLLIMILFVGGTLWIMYDLNYRMM